MIVFFGRRMLFGSCLGDLDGGGEGGATTMWWLVVAGSLLLRTHRGGFGWWWCTRAMIGLGHESLHLCCTSVLVDSLQLSWRDWVRLCCWWFCCCCLLHFPENAVLKKINILLWWIGVANPYYEKYVYNKLRNCNLIVPHCKGKCPVESKFKINPLLRHKSVRPLLQYTEKQFLGDFPQILASSNHYGFWGSCVALGEQKVKLNDEFGIESNKKSSRLVTNSSVSRHHILPFLPFFPFSNENHHHRWSPRAITTSSNPSPLLPLIQLKTTHPTPPTQNNSPY